jgi:hypothetical protein
MFFKRRVLFIPLLFLLAACGGAGSGNDTSEGSGLSPFIPPEILADPGGDPGFRDFPTSLYFTVANQVSFQAFLLDEPSVVHGAAEEFRSSYETIGVAAAIQRLREKVSEQLQTAVLVDIPDQHGSGYDCGLYISIIRFLAGETDYLANQDPENPRRFWCNDRTPKMPTPTPTPSWSEADP